MEKLTREQFIKYLCDKHKIPETDFDKYFVIGECDCEWENCKGWQVISSTKEPSNPNSILGV